MVTYIISDSIRDEVYRVLFTQGTIACGTDHLDVWEGKMDGLKNQVDCCFMWYLMGSLHTRGYVREQFDKVHYYWTLTDLGHNYLRKHFEVTDSIELEPDLQKLFDNKPHIFHQASRPKSEAGQSNVRQAVTRDVDPSENLWQESPQTHGTIIPENAMREPEVQSPSSELLDELNADEQTTRHKTEVDADMDLAGIESEFKAEHDTMTETNNQDTSMAMLDAEARKQKGRLGMRSTVERGESHVIVAAIYLDGPASNAGICCGDVIDKINGIHIASLNEFNSVLQKYVYVGEILRFAVRRPLGTGRKTLYRNFDTDVLVMTDDERFIELPYYYDHSPDKLVTLPGSGASQQATPLSVGRKSAYGLQGSPPFGKSPYGGRYGTSSMSGKSVN